MLIIIFLEHPTITYINKDLHRKYDDLFVNGIKYPQTKIKLNKLIFITCILVDKLVSFRYYQFVFYI